MHLHTYMNTILRWWDGLRQGYYTRNTYKQSTYIYTWRRFSGDEGLEKTITQKRHTNICTYIRTWTRFSDDEMGLAMTITQKPHTNICTYIRTSTPLSGDEMGLEKTILWKRTQHMHLHTCINTNTGDETGLGKTILWKRTQTYAPTYVH